MTEPITLGMAFLAGILGSGHCLGMCGGIATLPASGGLTPGRNWPRVLVYNLSRMLSYAFLGAVVGIFGSSLGLLLDIQSWSIILRLVTGLVVVLVGLQFLLGKSRLVFAERIGAVLWRRIAPLTKRLKPGDRLTDLALLGLMWGFLPCGLVYSMLTAATVSGSAGGGASLMLAFGLGTMPAVAGIGLLGSGAVSLLRGQTTRRVVGVALLISGVWLMTLPISQLVGGEGGHQHHQ